MRRINNMAINMSVEDAAKAWLQPESEDQPGETLEADVTEDEVDETEAEADELGVDDDQPDEVEMDAEADEAESEEAEHDDDDDDPLLQIQTSNGVEEIKFSELVSGYMRTKDYTVKTQQVAEERRAAEAERTALREQTAKLQDTLAAYATVQNERPKAADFTDAMEYQRARDNYEAKEAQKKQAADLYRQVQAEQYQELVNREREQLLTHFPDWRDPAAFREVATNLVNVAGQYGFSPDEASQIVDHRMVRILHDLSKLQGTQASQKANAAKIAKKVVKAAKRPAPNAKPSKQQDQTAKRRQKLDRVKKTGSIHDAAAAIIME